MLLLSGYFLQRKENLAALTIARGFAICLQNISFNLATIPADRYTSSGLTKTFLTTGVSLNFYLNALLFFSKQERQKKQNKKHFRHFVPTLIGSHLATSAYTEALEFASEQVKLADFSEWLDKLISTDNFSKRSSKYIDIYRRLKSETDKEIRYYLVQQAYQLMEGQ